MVKPTYLPLGFYRHLGGSTNDGITPAETVGNDYRALGVFVWRVSRARSTSVRTTL
jgi:hypothetical protein